MKVRRITMLLPDNVHPEHSIYYNGAFVLQTLQKMHPIDFFDLYIETKRQREISMPVFVLCLDWLFLLNLIIMNDNDGFELCS